MLEREDIKKMLEILHNREVFTITGKNEELIQSQEPGFVAYRSDKRSAKKILASGFLRNVSRFFIWDDLLKLYGPTEFWEDFKKGQAGEEGSGRQNLSQMLMRKNLKTGEIDIDNTVCISLTTRASIAPFFPSDKGKASLGKRWLYAVHVDSYFDAHAFEQKNNPKGQALRYNEIAVRDIPRGHILAAIECEVTFSEENKTRYQVFDNSIIWNVDGKDKNGEDTLKGIPHYRQKRAAIKKQFAILAQYEYLEITAHAQKLVVHGHNSSSDKQQVQTNTQLSQCTSFTQAQAQLSSKMPLNASPKEFFSRDHKKEFRHALQEELTRVATDKFGSISHEAKPIIQEMMDCATEPLLLKKMEDMLKNLNADFVQSKQEGHFDASHTFHNHIKNINIIIHEFIQKEYNIEFPLKPDVLNSDSPLLQRQRNLMNFLREITPFADQDSSHVYFQIVKDRNYGRALRSAAGCNNPIAHQLMEITLKYREALNINIDEQAGAERKSALHHAACKANLIGYQLLGAHGANQELPDASSHTPQYYAEQNKLQLNNSKGLK